jgi:hypothetical protein
MVAYTATASAATAQAPTPPVDEDAIAPVGLGVGPYDEMSALMEVTIFDIDVLTLTVRVGSDTGTRLRELTEDREYSDELADSVASVILAADELWARQVFHRDVGFGRLLDGMRETGQKAVDAGYVSSEYFEEFSESLPFLFGFLEDEGPREGDEIFFRVRGNLLRTVYRTVDGRVLMDQTALGAQGRRASIPSFFAPGTRFRKLLVESLVKPTEGAAP